MNMFLEDQPLLLDYRSHVHSNALRLTDFRI